MLEKNDNLLDAQVWELFGRAVELYVNEGKMEEYVVYIGEEPYVFNVHVREMEDNYLNCH